MKRKLGKKNKLLFIILTIVIIVIILIFLYFIGIYRNYDNQKYEIKKESVLYDDDFSYIKVEGDAYLDQKLDGNYYLIDNNNNKKYKSKIGPIAISYNKNDYRIYLYGSAFQVMANGEIKTIKGKTEITKASPTKFYKLRDRKYLFVDGNIRTNDNMIDTTGYVIIELDKQGNATFANHEINIKTIKPLILKGSLFDFDIANEQLIYENEKIDLKKVIGSTNEYKEKDKNKDKDDGKEENKEEQSDTTYYDEYMNEVINSINNLSGSISSVNEKTKENLKKDEIYFEFSKWVALKSVASSVTTIQLDYTVFDPNNEYQIVFANISSENSKEQKIYLNKNETTHIIRNLEIDTEYTITFGYQLVGEQEEIYEDVIKVKTKKPDCKLKVTKVTTEYIYYNLIIDDNYKFETANVILYSDNEKIAEDKINVEQALTKNGYTGKLHYSSLGSLIKIKVDDIIYNGSKIELNIEDKFMNE